jgi:diguanylate cyclase (GGDEF)-like protein
MANKKKWLIVFIIYIIYFVATVYNFDTVGNIVSPILTFIAFAVLIKMVSDHTKSKVERIIWVSYGLACFFWGSADLVWAIYEFAPGLDPETSVLITYLYPITNIFLGIGVLVYGIQTYKRWNGIQLLIDSIAIATVSLMLVWNIFFDKSTVMLDRIIADEFSSILSIVLDVIIFVGIAIWYISVRRGKVPTYIKIIAVAIVMFVITDIYYYYVYFKDLYIANTLVDAFYMTSLLLIAVGALVLQKLKQKGFYNDAELDYSNIGFKRKGIVLIVAPIVEVLIKGVVMTDLGVFLLIILAHEILSVYVQGSINNEILLAKEIEMNRVLEDEINRRTREILEKNKELEEKNTRLKFLSNQDTLTKLYNRRYFTQALEKEIETMKPQEAMAILFIDVDRFKIINDTYGHAVGDELLIALSKRLQQFNWRNTILARLGGDEFVIGLRGEFDYKHMEQISADIIKTCGETIEIGKYIFHVNLSIGISIYPLDANSKDVLMKNADIAMYQAKAAGGGKYISFDHSFTDKLNRKNHIELLLRRADFNQEFEVYYQPQFSIPDKRLVGAEALLRWNKSSEGFISPEEFIPVAEEIDYINQIGKWVMEQAIGKAGQWNSTYASDLKVGINVSPKQLDNKDFINILKKIMKDNNILTQWIDIEITESVAIEGEYRIEQIVSIFEGVGVSISVDDFGTGYSSLSYLKFFPFERIKIAKPLIDAIATANYDLQIVKAIIMLAKSIHMKTIAEGVETQEQLDILVELGCDEIQGYLLGRPVPAEVFEQKYLKIRN